MECRGEDITKPSKSQERLVLSVCVCVCVCVRVRVRVCVCTYVGISLTFNGMIIVVVKRVLINYFHILFIYTQRK